MAFDVVIITGLSGSGMSSAADAFEDLGYFSVDNLPPQLIPTFVDLCEHGSGEIRRAALVVDIRSREFLNRFPDIYADLKKRGVNLRVIFLEADDETLLRRYGETRRPHPAGAHGVVRALAVERKSLSVIRELADEVIDTTELTIHDLRRVIVDRFGAPDAGKGLQVALLSFGFKHARPRDLDLLFDVRFLPNPHFVAELRPQSGLDQPVRIFLDASQEVGETLDRLEDLLRYLLPRYQREGKSYLTIGVGCTGGRHRSVYCAERLRERLAQAGYDAHVEHRDLERG
jgi:UPF0042 nucleotide-binding protein